jgi:hypothetical protein
MGALPRQKKSIFLTESQRGGAASKKRKANLTTKEEDTKRIKFVIENI